MKSRQDIICIAGPPGSGKTTVGTILSRLLRFPFSDLDRLIEVRDGRPIPEIFSQSGEAFFRSLESDCLADALENRPSVLAVGGGCLLDEGNRSLVLECSLLFTLIADDRVLLDRCAGGERPLAATRTELEELLEVRREHYQSLPNRIDTGGRSPDEVAAGIEEEVRERLRDNR